MQPKLLFVLVCVCVMIIGKSAPLLGAEHTHARNPKLDSARQEQLAPPEATSRRSDTAQRLPTNTSAEEEMERTEKRCSWDVAAAAGRQPPPGSPLSAFPLVSYPNPRPEENQH